MPRPEDRLRRRDGVHHVDGHDPNVALVPPIQSNAAVAGDVENALGVHLIAGSQRRLTGVDLALGVNIVQEDATGEMLAIVGNVVGHDFAGLSTAVVGNVVAGDAAGMLASSTFNVVGGHMRGVQAGVAFNWAHGGFDVAQVSSGLNVGLAHNEGLALAPINVHDTLAGAQIGVINVGADVTGAQVSVINIAGAMTGAQVGVINIAGATTGAQVGVINVAGSSTASVGVVSIVGDGRFDVGVMGTELFPAQAVLRMGSRSIYGVVGVGVSPWFEEGHTIVQLNVGPGIHLPLNDAVYVDVEAVYGDLFRADELFWESGLRLATTARALVGWQVFDHLSVYAGPALNVFVLDDRPVSVPLGWKLGSGEVTTTISPGLAIGLQL